MSAIKYWRLYVSQINIHLCTKTLNYVFYLKLYYFTASKAQRYINKNKPVDQIKTFCIELLSKHSTMLIR